MKSFIRILSSLIVLMLITGNVFAQKDTEKKHYTPREEGVESSYGISGAMDYYRINRNNPVTDAVSPIEIQQAHKQANLLPKGKAMNWEEIGPDNIGGRTRAIIVDRNNSGTLYAGGVAGGLWKSVSAGGSWVQAYPLAENYAVSAITQDVNGIIYFGTGEGFGVITGGANGSTSFPGGGIYKSTDATGTSFTQLTATLPATYSDKWAYIYEMAADPTTAKVYACTKGGLYVTVDNGVTWENPVIYPTTNPFTGVAHDVEVASNGSVYVVVGNKVFYSPNGTVGSFSDRSITGLSTIAIGRIELAVAPSNPNTIYASVASNTGTLKNIYQSKDAGVTWDIIGPGGSANFNVFGSNNQGFWNNIIKVFPNDENHILVGGIDLWDWSEGNTWTQKSLWYLEPSSAYYLHADQHDIVFSPNDPNTFYHGSDGGVSRSSDGGNTFTTQNRKYSTIQFYSLAVNCFDQVMGGTQDNGTLVIPGNLTTTGTAFEFIGGDGGYSAMSYIDPNLIIGTLYYGEAYRSNEFGVNPRSVWNQRVIDLASDATSGDWLSSFAGFVTPMLLDENIYETNSPDSVSFVADTTYNTGDTVSIISNTANYPFPYILDAPLAEGDSISVTDIIQARFYMGVNNAVWMTKTIHDFSGDPEWWKIASISGTPQTMAVSPCGNYLFVGCSNGNLYRISNLVAVKDSLTASIENPNPYCIIETKQIYSVSSRSITSIATDPNNADNLLITLGQYGSTQYVYLSTNALDSVPTFANKTGDLPKSPVYGSSFEVNNSGIVILGTEVGVFTTDNINAASPSWTENNDGLGRVPVYRVIQQQHNFPGSNNYGMIYLGTHGRGAFKSTQYVGVEEMDGNENTQKLNVFPNPASDITSIEYNADQSGDALINIYNVEGKLVQSQQISIRNGYNKFDINISELPGANYLIELRSNEVSVSGQLIKL
ncbi:MAG: T9SS type A sorting domain-containing protein [Bacteroidales bacterium]|nr:T9SS type A sorting domain-containing protein [Bacteroidales bacterium]